MEEATRLARRAMELGREDAIALCWGGFALAYVAGDLDGGAALIKQALSLNPNLAAAWNYSGWIEITRGRPETGIDHIARAMRLSPLDPTLFHMRVGTAWAHFFAGRYEEACSWVQDALRDQPNFIGIVRVAAASYAMAGRLEEAKRAVTLLRQLDPALRISNLGDRIPPLSPNDLARYEEGLRIAGCRSDGRSSLRHTSRLPLVLEQ